MAIMVSSVAATASCTVRVGTAVDWGTAAIPVGGGSEVEIYDLNNSSTRSAFAIAPIPRIAITKTATNHIVPLRLLDEGCCGYFALPRFFPRLCLSRNWRRRMSTHAAQVQAGG